MSTADLQSPPGLRSPNRASYEGAIHAADEAPAQATLFRPAALVGTLSQTAKIMLVDDEPVNVKVVQKHLKIAGYQHFVTSTDPVPVMEMIAREMPDVILIDVMMPVISGLDILRMVREDERLAHIPMIVLTAADNTETRMEALNLGATDFLGKPLNTAELVVRVRNALLIKAHHDHLKGYAEELEHQVRRRTAELARSRLELIHCLGRVAEYRDNETGRHVIRVGRYAEIIAWKLGLDEPTIELIAHAAPLHDMGKVGIPDNILLKPDKLTPDEFEIMKRHVVFGKHAFEPMSPNEWRTFKSHTFLGEMIMDVESSPIIAMAAQIALTHHEKWDGTGYPAGLAGDDIPLGGRITAVADVFDALSSKRPYKPAFPLEKCFTVIKEGSGTHFDPRIVEAFLSCREDVVQIQIELADVE
ncbi:MAG TPA: HD domain-containing phosphohydrolase [Pirellulales bacterium]|jgi:putative two-component system response regulator|nr:HD domain-containing phosphohydrolase [Pirellulales bacterium]